MIKTVKYHTTIQIVNYKKKNPLENQEAQGPHYSNNMESINLLIEEFQQL